MMLRQTLKQGICLKPYKELCLVPTARHLSGKYIPQDSAQQGESSRALPSRSRPNFGDSRTAKHDTDYSHRPYKKHHSTSRYERSPSSRDFPDSKNFRSQSRESSKPHWKEGDRDDRKSREVQPGRRPRTELRAIRGDLERYLYDNYKPISPPQRPSTGPRPSRLDSSFDIIDAIRTTFPHVKNPTPIQARLIPAIIEGHDVLLNDETGSGKTFGSVIALISELREPYAGITTLYIVPHRDLAYQIESWCQQLLTADPSTSTNPSAFVKVLARPNVTPELLNSIQANPPRILIATPGGLVEALKNTRLSLPITLRRIIVDEVDTVMNVPPRFGPKPKMRHRHRPEAAQVIDWLLEARWRERLPKPQMVLMSATLRVHVRAWLFEQKRWLTDRVVRLDGIKEKIESGELSPGSRSQIVHSAVVIEADGTLRNMQDKSDEDGNSEGGEGEPGILTQDPEAVLEMFDQVHARSNETVETEAGPNHARVATTSHPTKGLALPPNVLEAIATSVALDVTNRALLVVPSGVSVSPVVDSLKNLGVDARLLDFRGEIEHVSTRLTPDEEIETSSAAAPNQETSAISTEISPSSESKEATEEEEEYVPNPTLLVANTATVRGVDIPTLSHVYIVGGVESEEIYRHIAGRAGRFGAPGTVVSFVGAEGAEGLLGSSSGEHRLRKIYERIGVERVPFTHIQ